MAQCGFSMLFHNAVMAGFLSIAKAFLLQQSWWFSVSTSPGGETLAAGAFLL